MAKNCLCVIGVYFGPLPRYFSLWMKSCEKNPSIDFFVFTDQKVLDTPANVFVIPMTLREMKAMATEALGFEVSLQRPYKCCDYKPCYGLIFKPYIKGYDYWGHCDFDMVFGDLQSFFETYNLYDYDRFLALGHLSMYKNTDEVNERFRCSGSRVDYRTVFTTDRSCVFDELSGMTAIYQKHSFPLFAKRIFADVAMIYQRFRIIEQYPLDVKAKNYKYQAFYWENGKVYRAFYDKGTLRKEEYIYIHFKKRPDFSVVPDVCAADSFYITNRGFLLKKGEVSKETIRTINPYPGALFEIYEKIRFEFLEQVKRGERCIKRMLITHGQE